MRFFPILLAACAVALPAAAQIAPGVADPRTDYATVATLVLRAPVVADVTIRSASQLKPAEAIGVAPGRVRFYVVADVGALIRGPGAVPPRLATVVEVPLDGRGRPPKLGKQRLILFGRPVPDRPAELQLAGTDAQLAWSPELDAQVRGVVREAIAPDAPPQVTGVGRAFHVAGALPGEGETQVFLATATGRPVSLAITRAAGAPPRWGVALGDIVDAAAAPPPRDTLLWYRLACFLPRDLPAQSLAAGTAPADAARAREDYRFVLASLGPCRG